MFKDRLAAHTKGYGGADLRALCTEAALTAIQRTYPQIYKTQDKLKVDAESVIVQPKDFMMSLKKITPSSERSTASGAAPLSERVEPLLNSHLNRIKELLKETFPDFKRLSPLEEAEYEDDDDPEMGFQREMIMEGKFGLYHNEVVLNGYRFRELAYFPPQVTYPWPFGTWTAVFGRSCA